MKKYKEATCKGSFELGTACGKCERCNDELKKRQAKKPKKKLVARLVSKVYKGKYWSVWDKEHQDYAFTIFMEVPVFKSKKQAVDIIKMWNEQAKNEGKPQKYKLIEVDFRKK